MADCQAAKTLVREYYREMSAVPGEGISRVLGRYTRSDYRFRGVHPLNELTGAETVAAKLWEPLHRGLEVLQRRQDVFMAGENEIDGQIWVCSMGHLMGLFAGAWLGIPANGKLVLLRYAEFHRIQDDHIAETGFFCDLIGLMEQVGLQPLPLQTGAELIVPGPHTHDGLLFERQPQGESLRTLALVNQMRSDLHGLRQSSRPLDVLASAALVATTRRRRARAHLPWRGPLTMVCDSRIPGNTTRIRWN